MKAVLILAVCLVCGGCEKRPARVAIPASCMKVKITDFTQPCDVLKDGNLMCDRVRVHVNCIAPK